MLSSDLGGVFSFKYLCHILNDPEQGIKKILKHIELDQLKDLLEKALEEDPN